MTSVFDKIHSVGMSPDASTYMEVDSFMGPDKKAIAIEPPLVVVLEGQEARKVAFQQDALAARYTDEELRQIGEGSSTLGMQRVIGDIAMGGGLVDGATKPLILALSMARL